MNRKAVLSAAVSLAVAAGSQGSIMFNSGMTTYLGTPPANCQQFSLTGITAYCWDEQQNVLASATPVNLNANGTYTGFTAYAALVSGAVDSHFIHFDPSPNAAVILGSVTFSGNIVGVIYDELFLSATDLGFGSGGTTYDTGNFLRSMNSNILMSNVLTVAGSTLNFQIGTGNPGQLNRMVEIRVLTQVPAPGALGLAGVGGLVALRRRR